MFKNTFNLKNNMKIYRINIKRLNGERNYILDEVIESCGTYICTSDHLKNRKSFYDMCSLKLYLETAFGKGNFRIDRYLSHHTYYCEPGVIEYDIIISIYD